jgi:hypothetical protein
MPRGAVIAQDPSAGDDQRVPEGSVGHAGCHVKSGDIFGTAFLGISTAVFVERFSDQ